MRYGSPLGACLGSPARAITYRNDLVRSGNTSIDEQFEALASLPDGYYGIYANSRLIQNVFVYQGEPSEPIAIPIAPNSEYTNLVVLHLGQLSDPFYHIERVARTFEPEQKVPALALKWQWRSEFLGSDIETSVVSAWNVIDGSLYSMEYASLEQVTTKKTWGRLICETFRDTLNLITRVSVYRLGQLVAQGTLLVGVPVVLTLTEQNDSGISGSVLLSAQPPEGYTTGSLYWRFPEKAEIYYSGVNPPVTLVGTAYFNKADLMTFPLTGLGLAFGTGMKYSRIRMVSDTGVNGNYSAVTTLSQVSPPLPPSGVEVLYAGMILTNNRISYSNDFENVSWGAVLVTLESETPDTLDPFSGSFATKIFEGVANGVHALLHSFTFGGAGDYWHSFYAKAGTGQYMYITNQTYGRIFDLVGGTVQGHVVNAPMDSIINSIGNGWYRCSIKVTGASGGDYTVGFATSGANSGTIPSYTGTNLNNYVYGAQTTKSTTAVVMAPYFETEGFVSEVEGYVKVKADYTYAVNMIGNLYRWTHGEASNVIDVIDSQTLITAGTVVLSDTAVKSLSTTYNYVIRLKDTGTSVEEQSTIIVQVEFDAVGWVKPRPNTPGLLVQTLSTTAGDVIALTGTYDDEDEKGEAVTLKLYIRAPGAAYNFATPVDTETLGTAIANAPQLRTVSFSYDTAVEGIRYICAKAATIDGTLSENYSNEIVIGPDNSVIDGYANLEIQVGQG